LFFISCISHNIKPREWVHPDFARQPVTRIYKADKNSIENIIRNVLKECNIKPDIQRMNAETQFSYDFQPPGVRTFYYIIHIKVKSIGKLKTSVTIINEENLSTSGKPIGLLSVIDDQWFYALKMDIIDALSTRFGMLRDLKKGEKYVYYAYRPEEAANKIGIYGNYRNLKINEYQSSNSGENWLPVIANKIKNDLRGRGEIRIGVRTQGSYSKYITGKIESYLGNINNIVLVPVNDYQLKEIIKQQELQMTGLYDEKTVVEAGKMIAAEHLLVTTVFIKKNSPIIELQCKVADIEAGKFLSGGVIVEIKKSDLSQ